jgi:hypothetical protein
MEDLIVHLLDKNPEDRPFNARWVQGYLGELVTPGCGAPADESQDRPAAEVRPIRESLIERSRMFHARSDTSVSWGKLGWLVAGILAAILLAVLVQRLRS